MILSVNVYTNVTFSIVDGSEDLIPVGGCRTLGRVRPESDRHCSADGHETQRSYRRTGEVVDTLGAYLRAPD